MTKNAKVWLSASAALVVLFIILGESAPPEETAAIAAPEEVAATTPARTKLATIPVEVKRLTVSGYISYAGSRAERILSEAKTSTRYDEIAVIRLAFSHEVKDRFGNLSSEPLFNIDFRMEDVQAANFDNLAGGEVLDLASAYETQSANGAVIVLRACNSGDITPRLCRLASID